MNPVPYMETLQRIAAGMGPQRGFQSSLNSLLSLLTERHGFLRPHLVIFDPETRTLRLCVADGAPRSAQVVYEPGMGVTGQVFVTGKPVIVECLKGHPVFLSKFFVRTDDELSSLAFLSVPVLAPQLSWEPGREQARKVIGVLSVDTPRASREELERQRCFLEVVAGMIAAQATYLQDDMARQQRLAERRGDRPHVAGDLDGGILAVSESMCEALKQASYAGHGRGPVLLRGEPGTGKARVAAFIHTASVRNELPLVRFYASRLQSSGADRLTEEQAERELFGYRKGAFPGAVQTRKGLFELANCSTLFIEDIDKLSLSIQTQILHVLQEQSVVRTGGGQPVGVDVRFICSSSADLENLVAQGAFLEDLYNRITAFPITLPPLRERPEDILPLADMFLKASAEALGRTVERISTPAQELLLQYPWPGNAGELAQCMKLAVQGCDDLVLRAAHLPQSLQTSGDSRAALPFNDAVARFEQELLIDALQHAHGNMLQAARDLQVSYRIVNYKVKKYNIDPRSFA